MKKEKGRSDVRKNEVRRAEAKRPGPRRAEAGKTESNRTEEVRDDLLVGRHPVLEALKGKRSINKIIVAKGSKEGSIREILAIAKEQSIPTIEVERSALDIQSATKNHQGVIAFVSSAAYVDIADILEIARAKGESPFVLILDGLEDPHNVGALLRTAECAGVHGVILPKRRGVGVTSTVAKAAAGATEHLAIARVTNLVMAVEELKKAGLWIVGSVVEGEKPYYEQDFSGSLGLIVGSEGKGISRLLQSKCDFLVTIPMTGKVQSLNASVAGALLMFERMRIKEKSQKNQSELAHARHPDR
ncbi:23S rRNA (guanosine(2251)-2'-O)-methyltransferase RlmB [Heliorestis acidaminivorans]|uniref:23S rRNA (Guanosine(2251)-2'-O)-methyltransferase RlmB n=1 Tax=Heliorestis acidaminivorans TaxID=553427 RepID=A0A6I0EXT9_9FIRM|nr:23S rRNA (guanosine(2251)-2'-O)-methyltransferase RlmB [Heliorestis acidaminivorans]KAB2951432.1 23S rRNA (guanosine(2251)-2'-O)-methyltransferase RlmB [Heliorestis acidaminivorans]